MSLNVKPRLKPQAAIADESTRKANSDSEPREPATVVFPKPCGFNVEFRVNLKPYFNHDPKRVCQGLRPMLFKTYFQAEFLPLIEGYFRGPRRNI